MKTLIGTSGFSYPAWKGTFYPEGLAAKKFLSYYAERFPVVEINNTFYRMPAATTLEGWLPQVPAGFTFALKVSQRITHQRRLKEAAADVKHFFEVAAALGAKRGPSLFQLPPNFKKDVPRLADFLAILPKDARPAFEFRHASWFEDDALAALEKGGAALCVSEEDERQTPCVVTADWGYLRLRRKDYSEAELAAWAGRIRAQPWREAYVFLKHEDEGKGPRLAARLVELLAAKR